MSIDVKGLSGMIYVFEGPYYSLDSLDEGPGVYIVLCDGEVTLMPVKIGHSMNMKETLISLLKSGKFEENCPGALKFAQLRGTDVSEKQRTKIARDISNYLKRNNQQ